VAKTYAAKFQCSYGDAGQVVILRNRDETLEQIQRTARHFECPVHGVQLGVPVEAKEITEALTPESKPVPAITASFLKDHRRSKRIPLRIRVLVYGRAGNSSSFREETSTRIVTAHGGLLALTAPVEVGETLLVVNLATRKEEECRVASVKPQDEVNKVNNVNNVGLAFLRSAPSFWGLDFPSRRR
jgi:hypothetical protein